MIRWIHRGLWGAGALSLLLVAATGAQAQSEEDDAPVDSVDAAEELAPPSGAERVSITVSVDGDGKTTELGTVVIQLMPEKAPKHVANFLKLVREGFYDGTSFHRIVPAFIVQGGDPIGKSDWKSKRIGTGGPAWTVSAEISEKHLRGSVAAARKPDEINPRRESSGSQFFICLADLPALDRGGYSVFGRVVEGMDVVDKIARVKNTGQPRNQALQRVVMSQVRVVN